MTRTRWIASLLFFALACGARLSTPAPAAAQASFTPIGHIAGDQESRAWAVSADGSVVAGGSYYSGTSLHAIRWSAADGLTAMTTPDFGFNIVAYALSGDGLVLGGTGSNLIDMRALSWTTAGGEVPLFTRGTVRAASTTGDVLVGTTIAGGTHSLHAIRWSAADGTRSVEPAGGLAHSMALGVSGDGGVVVGQAIISPFNTLRAFRWTSATGMVNIGSPDFSGPASRAWAVSRDGATVVGGAQFPGTGGPYRAFRWSVAGGMQDLGGFPGTNDTDAFAVSDDGNTIVGAGAGHAFIWQPALGFRNLQELLGGLVPAGWTLDAAQAVSADGTVIVGWGHNPQFQAEGWVVRLPNGVAAVGDPARATAPALTLAAFPNPLHGAVRLAADGAQGAAALTIVDAAGRVVRRLAAGSSPAAGARADWTWDARDEQGRAVPAGVYFALLRSGERAAREKLVVVR